MLSPMALSFPILSPQPAPLTSSFLPSFTPPSSSSLNARPRPKPLILSSSSPSSKIVRYPPLDRHASNHSRLRFASKLQTLLLSKPRRFLPLRVLSRCRRYLGLPPSRPLLPLILRYPSLFRLFHAPSHTSPSLSLLSVTLTPQALSLAHSNSLLRSRIALSLAAKLHRLLMLAHPHHRLLLSKLSHLAPDLGLPPDFRSRLGHSFPSRFRTVQTPYGPALEMVSHDPSLAATLPPIQQSHRQPQPIIDRPPKFKQLDLRRGLNLKRRHRDYLIRFQDLPEASPYAPSEGAMSVEKRACAVVREVLGMTVEKRTLVDHLTHFRKEFGLPNRLRGMLVRHPEMFYVSIKGQRDSVFLVEAYDDKGKLLVKDELVEARERLVELVREGKRMRREAMRGIDEVCDEDENADVEEENVDDEDDGFGDLFDSGIGDDWEDVDTLDNDENGGEVENSEFWSKRAADVERSGGGGVGLEAW